MCQWTRIIIPDGRTSQSNDRVFGPDRDTLVSPSVPRSSCIFVPDNGRKQKKERPNGTCSSFDLHNNRPYCSSKALKAPQLKPIQCNRTANRRSHLTRNLHRQLRAPADALGNLHNFPRHMLGNIRILLLPVLYRAKTESIMDVVWTTAPQPLLFSYGASFEVSGVVYRSMSRIIDSFGHSPVRSARAHELIVERYGRSVRVQGSGPVSVACSFSVA